MGIYRIKSISTDSTIGLWEMTESWQELVALADLEPLELLQLEDKKTDKRKLEWLACRMLLQEMTSLPPIITHDKNRKPHLKNSDYQLSMSHSGAFACVYISKATPVGVDVQQMKPSISKGIDYFLGANEQQWINPADNVLLHLIWSAKESVFKYAGDPDLDLKKDLAANAFESNQNGNFEVSILKPGQTKVVPIAYETFADYVLTWTI